MIQDSESIVEYWLGAAENNPQLAATCGELWYGTDVAVDQHIKKTYGETLLKAESGKLDNWVLDPQSGLALVILLDQFSRNIYRGSADAYKNDAHARNIAGQMIDLSAHRSLSYLGRAFLYHPYHHSESIKDQDRSVKLFTELVDICEEEWREQLNSFLKFAIHHRNTILKFGRFPHRNALLGRENTAQERDHLSKDKRTWGQQKNTPDKK